MSQEEGGEDIPPPRRRRRRESFEEEIEVSRRLDLEPRRVTGADKIAWKVAFRFAFSRWLRRDDLREFFGEAQLAVVSLLRRRLKVPEDWIYTVAKQAIVKYWQTSSLIYIKPTTRARWVKEGRKFEDFQRHSYQTIFDSSDSIRGSVQQQHTQWGRRQREDAPWGDYEQMILEEAEIDADRLEQTPAFQLLRSMCVDDIDEMVLTARWDHGVGLNGGTLLHLEVIAASTGIKMQEVKTRLKEIERRYYQATGRKLKPGPLPMGTRPKAKKKAKKKAA